MDILFFSFHSLTVVIVYGYYIIIDRDINGPFTNSQTLNTLIYLLTLLWIVLVFLITGILLIQKSKNLRKHVNNI
jgi:hypothetical protein